MRQNLLTARIATTRDPFLRDNLSRDLSHILARIEELKSPAA
jgi:hypothetical protein